MVLAHSHSGYGPLNVLLEWFLIGSVVYVCVRFLRGTRGSRVFTGVAFVLVAGTLMVNLVAEQLGLERIKILYTPFVTGMFLVTLVVFQPELRRGLMRLGETRWFAGLGRDVDKLVEEICRAVTYLSKNKIGALIAIERDVPLGVTAAGGTRLDAELSAELLMTIFWPGSALHDLGRDHPVRAAFGRGLPVSAGGIGRAGADLRQPAPGRRGAEPGVRRHHRGRQRGDGDHLDRRARPVAAAADGRVAAPYPSRDAVQSQA